MSSKRHIRRRACAGKQRHADQAAAFAHLTSLRRRSAYTGALDAYRCRFCKGWNVGHSRRPG